MSRTFFESNEIYLRMDEVREYFKLNKAQFAAKLGITASYYGDIRRKRVGISAKMFYGLAINYPGVNMRWLITGSGEMLNEAGQENIVRDAKESYRTVRGDIQDLITDLERVPAEKVKALAEILRGLLRLTD